MILSNSRNNEIPEAPRTYWLTFAWRGGSLATLEIDVRSAFVRLHRHLGLAAAAYLLSAGVTGALLVGMARSSGFSNRSCSFCHYIRAILSRLIHFCSEIAQPKPSRLLP